jgi:predicted amidophosphoribosyltransferase
MKCWECKKQVTKARRICYVDDSDNERFRNVCDDCYPKLKCAYGVHVHKITQTSLKRGK